jgi:hypothetical protein
MRKGSIISLGALPPDPRSFAHWSQGASGSAKRPCRSCPRHGPEPEAPWQRMPLRLPSGRAVSCMRHPPSKTTRRLNSQPYLHPNRRIPLLNRLQSAFEPSLSAFEQAPAPKNGGEKRAGSAEGGPRLQCQISRHREGQPSPVSQAACGKMLGDSVPQRCHPKRASAPPRENRR